MRVGLLDALAVAGHRCELALLGGLAQPDVDSLEEAIASGMVSRGHGAIAFRHELARLAVEESIPAHQRESLHRRALELLSHSEDGDADPARLAHHAKALDAACWCSSSRRSQRRRLRGSVPTARRLCTTAMRCASRSSSRSTRARDCGRAVRASRS